MGRERAARAGAWSGVEGGAEARGEARAVGGTRGGGERDGRAGDGGRRARDPLCATTLRAFALGGRRFSHGYFVKKRGGGGGGLVCSFASQVTPSRSGTVGVAVTAQCRCECTQARSARRGGAAASVRFAWVSHVQQLFARTGPRPRHDVEWRCDRGVVLLSGGVDRCK